MRAVIVFALLLVACPALAADPPKLPASCETIREQVSLHGRLKAIRWARQNGYSWAQIAEARKCLR